MKHFFCDCCGKQTNESDLMGTKVNSYQVDLCYKCHAKLMHKLEYAQRSVEVEFMETMVHQPLAFKYHCE